MHKRSNAATPTQRPAVFPQKTLRLLLGSIAIISLSGCAWFTEHSTGQLDNQLMPCPSAPRCVNSDAFDADKKIAPLEFSGSARLAWQRAINAVEAMPRTQIVQQTDNYLHAEVISPWRVYTDDLELLLRANSKQIAVRSSGRIGYYDFNVNRDRIEELRKLFNDSERAERQ